MTIRHAHYSPKSLNVFTLLAFSVFLSERTVRSMRERERKRATGGESRSFGEGSDVGVSLEGGGSHRQ